MHRPGPYQIQAAIAAVHARRAALRRHRLAPDPGCCMTGCCCSQPSPVVRLNRAVATRFAVGPQAALAEVEPLAGDLDGYRLFHAVRAELLADARAP